MKHKRSYKIYPVQKFWAAKTLRRGKSKYMACFSLVLYFHANPVLDNTPLSHDFAAKHGKEVSAFSIREYISLDCYSGQLQGDL